VKIVNQQLSILFGGGSVRDWNLKWGYRSDRRSELEIEP
jgi:hypothetical protein